MRVRAGGAGYLRGTLKPIAVVDGILSFDRFRRQSDCPGDAVRIYVRSMEREGGGTLSFRQVQNH